MHLTGTKILNLKQEVKIFISCFLFLVSLDLGATNDSLKYKVFFVPGIKIFNSSFDIGPKIGSNCGLEIRPLTKRYEYFVRNYFNVSPIVTDTISYKGLPQMQGSLHYLSITNVVGMNRYFKNNKYKIGVGLYYERLQDYTDKFLFVFSGHFAGLEWSIYSKCKWANIAFKHQFQFIGQTPAPSKYAKVLDAFQRYRFSLCIEIPINIK